VNPLNANYIVIVQNNVPEEPKTNLTEYHDSGDDILLLETFKVVHYDIL